MRVQNISVKKRCSNLRFTSGAVRFFLSLVGLKSPDMIFHPNFTNSDINPDNAEELFSKNLKTVEIGISSYCNRVCNYCPNSVVDRRTEKYYMSDGVFNNILWHLEKIKYAEDITIHRYNEPLADWDYAVRRIAEIRTRIPRARIIISTNGDYLTHERVRVLCSLGVFAVHATYHGPLKIGSTTDPNKKLELRAKRLGFPVINAKSDGNYFSITLKTPSKMILEYRVVDFNGQNNSKETGFTVTDRGGSVILHRKELRDLPCFAPFSQIQVDYDGSVQPCCNIHSNLPQHANFSIGHINEKTDIFTFWFNRNYKNWRKSLLSYGEKSGPCKYCEYNSFPSAGISPIDKWQIGRIVKRLPIEPL